MKKFFTYSNENITGRTYFLRQFLNGFLIIFFGLGLYLIAITTYKRIKAFEMSDSNAMLCAIVFPILLCISMFFGPANFLCLIVHLILIFKNGNKQKQEILRTINQIPVEKLILFINQNYISLDEMVSSGLNHSKKEEIIKKNSVNASDIDEKHKVSDLDQEIAVKNVKKRKYVLTGIAVLVIFITFLTLQDKKINTEYGNGANSKSAQDCDTNCNSAAKSYVKKLCRESTSFEADEIDLWGLWKSAKKVGDKEYAVEIYYPNLEGGPHTREVVVRVDCECNIISHRIR